MSDIGTDSVRVDIRDCVAIICLDRPPVNALLAEMYRTLIDVMAQLPDLPGVSVAVLTGWGRKAFSAGADLKELNGLDESGRYARQRLVMDAMMAVGRCNVPLVCAMNGSAIGGGYGLASMCDYRVLDESAIISMPEIRYGSVTGGGMFFRRLGVREGSLREILLSGRRVDAAEALAIGLVDRTVSAGQALAVASEVAHSFAQHGRDVLRITKSALLEAEGNPDWVAAYETTADAGIQLIDLVFPGSSDRKPS